VIQFPHLRTGQPSQANWPPEGEVPARKSATAVDVVYGLICRGVNRTGDLQARSGYTEGSVRRALGILQDAGKVRKDGHGVWVQAS
jgi:Transcriptional regulators of sugar metabolism